MFCASSHIPVRILARKDRYNYLILQMFVIAVMMLRVKWGSSLPKNSHFPVTSCPRGQRETQKGPILCLSPSQRTAICTKSAFFVSVAVPKASGSVWGLPHAYGSRLQSPHYFQGQTSLYYNLRYGMLLYFQQWY